MRRSPGHGRGGLDMPGQSGAGTDVLHLVCSKRVAFVKHLNVIVENIL